MQINFKHVAATAMAAAMSLSLAVPAFAAGNGGDKTLTVTGDTLDNKNVYAVQMFTARVTESAGSNTFDSYELAEGWMPFFKDTTEAGINLNDQDSDGDVDSDDARAYVKNLANQNLVDFADKAQAWVRNHDGTPAETENTAGAEVFAGKIIEAQATEDKAVFSNLQPGYYLVYPEGGFTGEYEDGTRTTDAMLVNVPRDNDAEWNIKSTYPTVDKTVNDGNKNTPDKEDADKGNADNGSAQVGDVVTFTLKSTVPDMSDYDRFVFQFTDKLPAGLTLVHDNNSVVVDNEDFTTADITLKIGGSDVNMEVDKVTVAVAAGTEADEDKKILTVTINNLLAEDLLAKGSVTAGQPIVLTYKAMINENAVVEGNNPVTNEASVQYSNDPDSSSMGTSTPDESKVYTYDINIHKYANTDEVTLLPGAVFALSQSGDLGVLSMGTGDNANHVVNASGDVVESSLIPLKDIYTSNAGTKYTVMNTGDNYTFTTNADSVVNIAGLEAGTYYLYEVTAPDTYNKLKDPIKIEISVTGNATFEDPDYTVDNKADEAQDSTIKVQNKSGVPLPETGSIGTIGLTVAGVAIVLLGVFAPRKKKKSNQE